MAASTVACDPALHFDRWQFFSRPHPVDVEVTPDGFQTTGLSYNDFRAMHVESRGAGGPVRRLETPAWVHNNDLLREVVIRFVERRAYISGRPQSGTPKQRLQRALKKLRSRKPKLVEVLDRMCQQYVRLKKAGRDPKRRRKMEIEIEGLDTQLRFLGHEHKMAVGVIFHYYRLGQDSVATAAALGMKPPGVRMVCWRLNKIASSL